jgi:hypothetical protein
MALAFKLRSAEALLNQQYGTGSTQQTRKLRTRGIEAMDIFTGARREKIRLQGNAVCLPVRKALVREAVGSGDVE